MLPVLEFVLRRSWRDVASEGKHQRRRGSVPSGSDSEGRRRWPVPSPRPHRFRSMQHSTSLVRRTRVRTTARSCFGFYAWTDMPVLAVSRTCTTLRAKSRPRIVPILPNVQAYGLLLFYRICSQCCKPICPRRSFTLPIHPRPPTLDPRLRAALLPTSHNIQYSRPLIMLHTFVGDDRCASRYLSALDPRSSHQRPMLVITGIKTLPIVGLSYAKSECKAGIRAIVAARHITTELRDRNAVPSPAHGKDINLQHLCALLTGGGGLSRDCVGQDRDARLPVRLSQAQA